MNTLVGPGTWTATVTAQPGYGYGGKDGQKPGRCVKLSGPCLECSPYKCEWHFKVDFAATGLNFPQGATFEYGVEDTEGGTPTTGPVSYDHTNGTASGGSDYIAQYLPCNTPPWKTISIAVRRTDVTPKAVVAKLTFAFKCVDCPNGA